MPKKNVPDLNDKLLKRLDTVIGLLQDLFILEGVKGNMSRDGIRSVIGVDKARVNRISKHVKKKVSTK